jgi:uncharacterized LabA/DUF88 family protein
MSTAILVDGGFYLKRAQYLWGSRSPEDRASELFTYCLKHLDDKNEQRTLYRIFFYDCPPSTKKVYHPLLKRTVDLGKSDLFKWANQFHNELKAKRKMALRLGMLNDHKLHYTLSPDALNKLCRGQITTSDFKESDFSLAVEQKGVDMRIGLDISSISYKGIVTQMILISGDSDFIPAAKHARREGIDFILDPLWSPVKNELLEHVDGIKTCAPRPKKASTDVED